MHNYTIYKIKKPPKNGQERFRIIYAPSEELKAVQQSFLLYLEKKISVHRCSMAFTKDISIIDNAKVHQGQEFIKCFDLKDFFPSITYQQVLDTLLNHGITKIYALNVTNAATLNGTLVQGSPLSPFLSNIVAKPMDKKIYTLAKKNNVRYTRYADDITLSGKKDDVLRIEADVKQYIDDMHWTVNEEKTEELSYTGNQKVTGIVINEKPNIDRKISNKTRAIVNNIITYGEKHPIETYFNKHKVFINGNQYDSIDSLLGWLSFMKMVNPQKFKKQYKKLHYASKAGTV